MESSGSIGTLTRRQLALLSDLAREPQCGAAADEFRELPLLLGRYEVREPIGMGGMGTVFKGWDRRLEAHVAVKIARPGGGERNRSSLLREARAAAAVHHEYVVGIRDVGEAEDGTPFVVMDFLEGEPLSASLAERGRLPLSFALPLLEQVAHGLQAAHEAGIVHRDLKPSNIFVNERETGIRCTLIDFGLARAFDVDGDSRSLTKDGQLVGTPRYMSPEQITGGHPVGPASDIYAWGCVAYNVLRGAPPFGGTLHQLLHKHVHEEPPRLEKVPPPIQKLVRRCMDKDPARRPSSALELRAVLAAPRRSTAPARSDRLSTRVAAAVASVLVAAYIGWAFGRNTASPHLISHIAPPAMLVEADGCPPSGESAPSVIHEPGSEPKESEPKESEPKESEPKESEPEPATKVKPKVKPKVKHSRPRAGSGKTTPDELNREGATEPPVVQGRSRAEILEELDELD
ncbi:MAG: serine/threonine-protein kinase [Nannocystales bacterium]